MQSLNYGVIPDDLAIDEPYRMDLRGDDLQAVADIVNQGIDSHLEAVLTTQDESIVHILDSASMQCFLRRCMESDDENTQDIASCIMSTLDYEWV